MYLQAVHQIYTMYFFFFFFFLIKINRWDFFYIHKVDKLLLKAKF